MKAFSASEHRAKQSASAADKGQNGRDYTLARVRKFQMADENLKEACARLGIEKPVMTC
jgi:hypothetical protein